MKMSFKKILVPSFALIAGASLVGSISGTVAWYQYSTRVTAAFIGTTAKCSENLQIRIKDASLSVAYDSGWKSDLLSADINAYLTAKLGDAVEAKRAGNGSSFAPVTYGAVAKDAALPNDGAFEQGPKGNPIYQYADYSSWKTASGNNYVTIPLEFRVQDIDGANTATSFYGGKDIYLADVTIQQDARNTKEDISDAIRVHFAGTNKMLFAKEAGNTLTAVNTAVGGALDLNNDGRLDEEEGYEWDERSVLTYGVAGTQTAYNAGAAVNSADINPCVNDAASALVKTNAVSLGQTASSGEYNLQVTLTIWLEGWAKLNAAEGVLGVKADLATIQALAPVDGAKFYSATDNKVWEYDGSTNYIWEDAGVRELTAVAADAPATPANGEVYLDTDDNKFYTYDESGTTWGAGVDAANGDMYIFNGEAKEYDGTAWNAVASYANKQLGLNQYPVNGDRYKASGNGKIYSYKASDNSFEDVTDQLGSVWKAEDYIGSMFDVGMRFVTDPIA